MARLLAFTYASLTIGLGQSGSSYHLLPNWRFNISYERAELSFEVIVQSDTRATFLTDEAALVTAYTKPDQALLVVLGATTRHTFDPAANTGFNARPTIRGPLPGQDNTSNSARYECSVVLELPADLTGRAGRRSSGVDVSTSPAGRRSLVITGVYTALASNAARAQFASDIATYCASVLSGLTGTWQLVGTPSAATDDQDKTIRFTRRYEETGLYTQGAAHIAAHPEIVHPVLRLSRTRASVDSVVASEPLNEVTADYSAFVAIATTTDLDAAWTEAVRPYIVSEVERICRGTVVIVRETPLFELNENAVSASMSFLVSFGMTKARTELLDAADLGVILKPVWDGRPFSRDRYDGPGSHVKTYLEVVLSTSPPSLAAPSYPGFTFVRWHGGVRSWEVGLPGGATITMYRAQIARVYVRADIVSGGTGERDGGAAGGAGGGGGGGAGGGGAGGSGLGIFDIENGGDLDLEVGGGFGIFDINAGGFDLEFGS